MRKRIEWPYQHTRRTRHKSGFLAVVIVGAAGLFVAGAAYFRIHYLEQQLQNTSTKDKSKETKQTFASRELTRTTQQAPRQKLKPPEPDRQPDDQPTPSDRLDFIDPVETPSRQTEEMPKVEAANNEPEPEQTHPEDPTPVPATKLPQAPVKRPVSKDGQLPEPDFKTCKERISKSVVRIVVRTPRGESLGTGFAVGDGRLLVTNSHVISAGEGKGVISVETTDGRTLKAIPQANWPERDLAVLSIFEEVQPLALAKEDQFMWKTPVMLLGHGQAIRNLPNVGELSELTRWDLQNQRNPKAPLQDDTWLLKFTANVHPGHSGSPVVTPDGLVVGVTCMEAPADTKTNWAIHVKHIREILQEAVPDVKLQPGKLSRVEDTRMDRTRRTMALQRLEEIARIREQMRPKTPQRSPFADSFDWFNGMTQENIRRANPRR